MKHFLIILSFLLGAALVAFFYLNSGRFGELERRNNDLELQLKAALLAQQDAIIQKRISEQLENIALQQKSIAELERKEAERQRQIADQQKAFAFRQQQIAEEQRTVALEQRIKADSASNQAIRARTEAEEQRTIAVEQKNLAEVERTKAIESEKNSNRLRMLSLSRFLSIQSLNQKAAGNNDLATSMAYVAWKFTEQNTGDTYESDLFSALSLSDSTSSILRGHEDFIRDLDMIELHDSIYLLCSASQDGTIKLWFGEEIQSMSPTAEFFFEDLNFSFVKMNNDGNMIAAADKAGEVVIIVDILKNPKQNIVHTGDSKLSGLEITPNDDIVYSTQNGELGRIQRNSEINNTIFYTHQRPISCMISIEAGEYALIADTEGVISKVDLTMESSPLTVHNTAVRDIKCLAHLNDKIALGTESGRVMVYTGASIRELAGHISGVNDIVLSNSMLVSISYDRTIRMWDLKNNLSSSIVVKEIDHWGYAIDTYEHGKKVVFAGADMLIHDAIIDVGLLAERVHKRIIRDFTEEEWKIYVGESIPFESILDDNFQ